MLRIQSLTKSYPRGWLSKTRVPVLTGVSFDVRPGEIVGVVGGNGAGKSTLLHAVAGLLSVDSGTISLDGRILSEARARLAVSLCSSADRSFYYRLTLRANLQFFGALLGLRGRALERRIADALAVADLADVADVLYGSCSTGTRQRLTFARALLSDARLLLLDEPTRAVDPLHAEQLHRFIRVTLCESFGKTILVATNVLEEAWNLCDRVVLLAGGRVVAADTPQALNERFGKAERRAQVPTARALFLEEHAG
ncbi:MAG TPA: ATP-binding cassette domain-containing protein [Candidatus Baltobacteraceae bacterium]